jgi:hypothetical protein
MRLLPSSATSCPNRQVARLNQWDMLRGAQKRPVVAPRALLLTDCHRSKSGHLVFQNEPLGVKTGQYPHPRKEHIANIEQIVYSAVLALPGRGRFVAGLPNPGHKEHGS